MKKLLGKARSFADRAQSSQGFFAPTEPGQENSTQVSSRADLPKDEDPSVLENSDQHHTSSVIQPPTPLDVLRYRYHHGANLGGIFVLEKWLYGSMFAPGARGESELDAVTAIAYRAIEAHGVDATRQKWESHWASALSEYDLAFLTVHCTSIRLPIGYFTLGQFFTANTPFEGLPSEVYVNAWAAVKQLCHRLHIAGIGTLLDFHALPGGANGEAHSGTSSKKAGLWDHQQNLTAATRCLEFLASEIAAGNVPGCIGLQACNEAVYDAKRIGNWYSDILQKVSHIDSSIPLYISDAWELSKAISWVAGQNKVTTSTCPIIIDTHKYYTFSAADKAQSPQRIISRIPSELSETDSVRGHVIDGGAVDIVVGEWSCVLDGETWAKAGSTPRDNLVHDFGNSQCLRWAKKAGGSFFWTAKMDWMDGGEWGFVEMTKKGAIASPPGHLLDLIDIGARLETAARERQALHVQAISAHVNYWNRACPGQYFEHWRFEQGWYLGYIDAMSFFRMRFDSKIAAKMGGDSIGLLESWIRKRLTESGMTGGFVWEWEQGYRQGVQGFSMAVGV